MRLIRLTICSTILLGIALFSSIRIMQAFNEELRNEFRYEMLPSYIPMFQATYDFSPSPSWSCIDLDYTRSVLATEPSIDRGLYIITNLFPPTIMEDKKAVAVLDPTQVNGTALKVRDWELLTVLERNLIHPLVSLVFLIQDSVKAELFVRNSSIRGMKKLVFVSLNKSLTYGHAFEFASKFLLHRLVVFSNQDIYLGENWDQVNKTTLSEKGVAYALSRRGQKEETCNMRDYCADASQYIGSHDVYVFVLNAPVEESVLDALNYKNDVYGAENVLIWVMQKRMGLRVLNPCRVIKTYHLHCASVHSAERVRINNGRNTGWAGFTTELF